MSYREAMESNKKREKFRNLFAPLRRGKSPSPGPKVNGKPNIQANQRTDVWAEDFLLSLDGGGIRGLSSLFILRALMEKIAHIEQEGHKPAYNSFSPEPYRVPRSRSAQNSVDAEYRYLPCHYFDFIAGTSTGGLIAIMLGRLRMSVGHCIEEYKLLGGKIFGEPRKFNARSVFFWNRGKYDCENVKNAVSEVTDIYNPSVGADGWRHVPLKSPEGLCKTMVFATKEDQMQPYVFRSYDHIKQGDSHEKKGDFRNKKGNSYKRKGDSPESSYYLNLGEAHTEHLTIVARATSAAPDILTP